jgi:ABC-2 type transport system permease protein
MSRPASPISATMGQTVMELRLTARRGENVLVSAVIPAVVMVFFTSVKVVPISSGHPIDFLLPGSLTLAVVATSLVSLGIATAYERQYGVLKRLRGTPLTRAQLVVAKIGAVLVVELLQAILLIAVAWLLLGWRPVSLDPALLVVVVATGTIAFAAMGLLLAGSLRAEMTLALANGLFLVSLLFGGVIVPVDQLPGPLTSVAGLLPAAALSDALRVALGSDGPLISPLVVLGGWAVGAVVAVTRTFRWE